MKYRFVHRPYPHQRKALRRLIRQRGGGLQVPMRWGKTKVAIDFACCMHTLEGVTRVLVVCPLSVVGVWEEEVVKHTPPEYVGLLSWRFVNYESTYTRKGGRHWTAVPNKELLDFNADLMIVDESHRIGNPTTLQSKHVCKLGSKARFRVIMTGTMFHRKPFFVFGQAKFYDPSIFGTAFGAFKRRIAVMGGFGGYEVLRYINLRWMMRKMRSFVFISKYIAPGKPRVNPLYFHLTGKNLERYATMERDSVLNLGDETITAPIILTRHLRCQQIAGGWMKRGVNSYTRVGSDKFYAGADRIQEYADNGIHKFVVGCRFLPELKDAARAAHAAGYQVVLFHGGLTKKMRDRRRRFFLTTKHPCAFVSQIDTGREGIDLSVADTMLFWSVSPSFVAHDQFTRRIEKYNDKRVLQYDYLIARGTRDEVAFEAITLKEDVARFMVSNPDRVEELTAKERR